MTTRMPTRDTEHLASSNVEFLRQGRELIERLGDDEFAGTAPGTGRGGVGAHFRHVLDHYDCFLRGLEPGTVDYDRRERESELERRRERALEKLDEICTRLLQLSPRAAR